MPDRQTAAVRGAVRAPQWILYWLALSVAAGSAHAGDSSEQLFGPAEPRHRIESPASAPGRHYLEQVQPILEQRCVVCHGCYDSPCQLNLASPEGIDRGATHQQVYDSARLKEAPLTRLFEDAQTTAQWRAKGFYPVLNEREQTPDANLQASVMHHMLALKRTHPLPSDALLAKSFTLGLKRKQQCPKPEKIDRFAGKFPLWGMPYGLPGLSDSEFNTLENWLKNGALMASPPAPGPEVQAEVTRWEAFLNGDSLKQQLMSRYLYEHWFLAHLYFSELPGGDYFKIVRSSTPPGQAIEPLATRRPYDDPGSRPFYYRLWHDPATVLDKTHMPYALNPERQAWLQSLFLDATYTVEALPSYQPEVASNPFIAFSAIPMASRWQFLLEEAQFTVMNFIKGPVCRGQVSLDVIRDNFWVFFERPQSKYPEQATIFLNQQEGNLRIPSEAGSRAAPISTWEKYSKSQQAYLKAKSELLDELFPGGKGIDLNLVWDGGGTNQNAALTIFRHFDSASVVKGLVGPPPKTAWLIDYPILERIHYLLVAGFDVYGNMGHQLTTRLYMDFLRMEGEFNFLALLPPEVRRQESQNWYQGASKQQRSYLYGSRANFEQPTSISYTTDNPKLELYGMLQKRLAPALNHRYDLTQRGIPSAQRRELMRLQALGGAKLALLPEVVFLEVQGAGDRNDYYTVLLNTAHTNISSLFSESKNLEPLENTLTVAKGFIGSYPEAYWQVDEKQLPALVDQVSRLTDEASYAALMDRYGVRRTSADFWPHSDKVMAAHHADNPVENALLDYNRLQNR